MRRVSMLMILLGVLIWSGHAFAAAWLHNQDNVTYNIQQRCPGSKRNIKVRPNTSRMVSPGCTLTVEKTRSSHKVEDGQRLIIKEGQIILQQQ